MSMQLSPELLAIAPLITVIGGALAVIVSDALTPARRLPPIAVALAALGGSAALLLSRAGETTASLGGAYIAGPFVSYLGLLGVVISAITLLVAPSFLAARRLPTAEFAATLLFALGGAILVGAAGDLVTLVDRSFEIRCRTSFRALDVYEGN